MAINAFWTRNSSSIQLEGIYAPARRDLEIANVGTKPQPKTRSDRSKDEISFLVKGDANAANKIGGAFNADEPAEDSAFVLEIVDQHHHAGSGYSEIGSN